MDWLGRVGRGARRFPERLGEGWAVFVALWICGSALFLLSFLNLRPDGLQGFIPVLVAAERQADYGADESGSRFRPVNMDLIRIAIEDQTGGAQDANQIPGANLSLTRIPTPSFAPLALAPGQDSPKFAKATSTEDLAVNTRKPTNTSRPSHTPRPTHTPRSNPSPTNTTGPSTGASATPSTPTPQPTSPPGPAVTKKPSKTPKPTKTPNH
jgi:hypothetical protein